jgi:DNA-binding XRE family transcriptional regulator
MITRSQCRAARAGLEWTRERLAKEAGLAERTITDFERGARDPHDNNKAAMRAALEHGGVRFTPDDCLCFPETAIRADEGPRPDQLTTETDG